MSSNINNSAPVKLFQGAQKWASSTTIVLSEGAQHLVAPDTVWSSMAQHIETGAITALGVQIVVMATRRVIEVLNFKGSVKIEWGNHAGESNDHDSA
ncbi:hypothetical protein ACFV2Z_05125 [Streptomyces sp. NPDC059688]|uniref:hypothetical protein n=1 Tax=Streptomyces sp. NPDC059688 TaxID=3346906 RepID=UPI00369F03F1